MPSGLTVPSLNPEQSGFLPTATAWSVNRLSSPWQETAGQGKDRTGGVGKGEEEGVSVFCPPPPATHTHTILLNQFTRTEPFHFAKSLD